MLKVYQMKKIIGSALLFMAVAGSLVAQHLGAPEIDPGSGLTALALLSGGLLVLRARKR
jgi:hypothetical protein